jgi:hypothetical protein
MFHKRKFTPTNPQKYSGDPTNIIMRSSWETKFANWCHENLSASQAEKVLSHPGLDAVLEACGMLTDAKMSLINGLSKGTHGGIRQTKPEGYVQAHPGTGFANDLPGQFVKTIDQANWAPEKGR